jgi:ATP-dependent Clp protease ATP-binding subunit ClpA
LFERFTEKAIKVVTVAQEEALKAGHAKLYPEHILLGILKEGTGVSARFLKASGLEIETLREKINEIIVMKQLSPLTTGVLPFSSAVKKVLKEAWDKSNFLGTNYIGTEHLFLALLSKDNASILKILKESDLDIERIKSSVIRVIEKKSKVSSHPEESQRVYSFIPRYSAVPAVFEEQESAQIMNMAKEKLKDTKFEAIGTEQILLALMENKDSQLYPILESEGISVEQFYEKLNSIHSRDDEYDNNESLLTPRAYYTVNNACELAKELGSSSIKAEHFLLALLKEKNGLGFRVLSEMGVNTESLYNKVFNPIEKQKPVTLTILRFAKEEARRLGHSVVGTEQILLGILGEGTGVASIVLNDLGITLKEARNEVEKNIGYGNGYSEKDMLFTPRVKRLLEIAWSNAKKLNQPRIESEHLLLGIIKEKECVAMKVLENMGVDVLEIKQGILTAIQEKVDNIQ